MPTPREVLARFYRAMLDKNADDLADLYAADAVHEFAFRAPTFPAERLLGRDEVRAAYHRAWDPAPFHLTEIRDVVVHEGADPEVLFGEWRGEGVMHADGRRFEIGGAVVLRVREGEIVETRDYMDMLNTYHATGRLADVVAALPR